MNPIYRLDELTENQITEIKCRLAANTRSLGLTVEVTEFAKDHDRAGDALVLVKSQVGLLSQHTVWEDGGELSIRSYP